MNFKPHFLLKESCVNPFPEVKCALQYIPHNLTDITFPQPPSSTPSLVANSRAMTSCSRVDSHFPRARRLACVRTRAKPSRPSFLSFLSPEKRPLWQHRHGALISCQRRGRGFAKSQTGYHIIIVEKHYLHADSRHDQCSLQKSIMQRSGALYKM